jgi:nitrogen regulatory protein PII
MIGAPDRCRIAACRGAPGLKLLIAFKTSRLAQAVLSAQIFVFDLTQVVRIRTGERDASAI